MYKDASYENTIKRVKKILHDNNVFVEIQVTSGFNNVYAAFLRVENTPFYTNGKGRCKEQAIASAYGELMERLQNRTFFRFYNTFVLEESEKYVYFPTEIEKEVNYVVENKKYLGSYISSLSEQETKLLLENSLYILSKREYNTKKFLCIPYTLYENREKVYLPTDIIKHIYASNGMCAGNSKEEALVEGICEIFERYANKVLLSGKVTLPDIPDSVLETYDGVSSFMSDIRKSGEYEVTFKDCSLEMDLPVVCLMIFNLNCGKYFVKFGAHPVLEVALNRTITELFQGRSLTMSTFWFRDVSFYDNFDFQKDFKKFFRSGDGEYPTKIFEDEPSYKFNEKWLHIDYKSNTQLLKSLVKVIKNNNWSLLYSDVSFLGFLAYHVIVPEISEISKLDKKFILLYQERLNVNNNLRKLAKINMEELFKCVKFIRNCDSPLNTKLSEFLNITVNHNIFDNCLLGDLVFFYYLKTEAFGECIEILDEMIGCVPKMSEQVYYKCMKNYIKSVFIFNKDLKNTERMLYKFYEKDLVNKVINIVYNRKNIFKDFPVLECNQCQKCSYRICCSMKKAYEMNKQMLKGWE